MRTKSYKFAAIALVACSMLIHEILVTRICALRLYFHFAFLVISNCLLGLGASGALLSVYQDRWKKDPRGSLLRFTAFYLASLVVTYAVLLTFPIPEDLSFGNPGHVLALTAYNVASAVPFVFGGTVVGMLLTFDVEDVNRLYGADLVGAGLGCVACPALLPLVGAGGVFVATVLLALAATVVVGYERWGRRGVALGSVLGVAGLVVMPKLDTWYPVPSKGLVTLAHAIEKVKHFGEPFSVWTANSRIDLIRTGDVRTEGSFFMEGANREGLPLPPVCAGIAQDATAGTTIGNFSDMPDALAILSRTMYSAAYRQKTAPKVLVIGLGGGNDVWSAKLNGARSVKAIELNWPIVDIHRKVLRNFSRKLVDDPTVELVVGEGRSALMRETDTYDVIQMSGIDTWTALASGAYVLAENYLYTTEAIVSMYSHLAPDGILQIGRFAATMEAVRLLSNIRAALASLGVPDVENSVVALKTPDQMMAIEVKKGVFTTEEQQSIVRWAGEAGVDVSYLPGLHLGDALETFIRAKDPRSLVASYATDISPTTDDRPYFFSYMKWRHPLDSYEHLGDIPSVSQGNPLFILGQLAVSILLSALLVLLPVARRTDLPKSGTGRFLVYFAGLGLGFVFIEVSVIQKLTLFLGQPVHSLTVTLFSLLVFTGVGSLVLGGRYRPFERRLFAVPLLLAGYLVVFLLLSRLLVQNLIGLPVFARILLASVLLAPMGLLLGIPFSHGLRAVNEHHPALVPWAWAINGCASVVGSILTVIVSMNFGFSAVLMTAAGVYLVAFAALLGAGKDSPAGPPAGT
ncbi:MAG TPA: hypothetical protein VHE30_03315 [Polyangiaceae bacterium]|nr:hypothetical protein [Polyangiaceae bacterium]